jgi:CheY-like chemotaxis protein
MTRILVVDDEPLVMDMVASALVQASYHVLTAVDGAAVDIARQQHPDLILLDLMMPQMGGVEVSQRLRCDPQTAHNPIIAMSAYHRHLRQASDQLAADDHLCTPFDLDDLYGKVSRWTAGTG